MIVRVDQFHSGTALGDAVTQQMFFLRDELRALGFESDIWAQHITPALADEIRDVDHYVGSADELLLVHHSLGHTAFERLITTPTPKITVFHSITPARFFQEPAQRYFVRLGIEQLRVLAKRSVSGIAASNHNRREMLDAGFRTVDVVPVRTNFSAARAVRHHGGANRSTDWLFVGRVAPNKHQVEVVRAFAAYNRTFDDRAVLTLVGDTSMIDYLDAVVDEAKRLRIDHRVRLTGKVSDGELWQAYGRAGLFVCLSEHEGFGVPLLEAMAAGLPVIARRAAAVPETMGGAGILVDEAEPWTVAAAARLLATDAELRRRICEVQDRRLSRIESFDVSAALTKTIERALHPNHRLTVQVQGPFETSYSLAAMNRGLALELARRPELEVSIYVTEGPGDYTPKTSDLALHPEATELYLKSRAEPFPDVVIRQMYPPRVNDSPGGMTFQYFGWEESRLPVEYVANFNRHLDGIGATSRFVAELLRECGVVVPIAVVGNGVSTPARGSTGSVLELRDLRAFRFLHISSALPRKAVDILLGAYFDRFSGDDDVSLILKTFPNPHNTVADDLRRLIKKHPNPPDVRWIDRDLASDELQGLYWIADSYVHAARGEGFGLPVAEAMLAELPVISVSATGLADFVDGRTATTIPFTVGPASTHVSVAGSCWVEPDREALSAAMGAAFLREDEDVRRKRAAAAKELIETEHAWNAASTRWTSFIMARQRRRPGIKVAMVTTWNSRCGIAEYSRALVDGLGGGVNVEPYADQGAIVLDSLIEESSFRAWRQSLDESPDALHDALAASTADVVHIQYNFGFFNARELQRLIEAESKRRPVVVTLHRTADLQVPEGVLTLRDAARGLRRAASVIVHQRVDVELLAGMGVIHNVTLIPHGCSPPLELDMGEMRSIHGIAPSTKVVGTFGFLLPHKGLLDVIGALSLLRSGGHDIQLLAVNALHPDPISEACYNECIAEIRRLGLEPFVCLRTEYLPQRTAQELLGACDVITLPYGQTGESASGALRSVLPVGRPILVSDVPIFDDARDVLAHLPSPVRPEELADSLAGLVDPLGPGPQFGRAAAEFCVRHSWAMTGALTRAVYESILLGDEPRTVTT